MLRRNKYLARYPKFLWLTFKFAIGYLPLARLSSFLCEAAIIAEKQGRQAEMDIRQTDMKITDQIERELMQRCAAQAPGNGFGNPDALTEGGPWFTAAVVAVVTVIWALATQ